MGSYYINSDIIICILLFLNLPDLCRVQTSSKLFNECVTFVKGQLKEVTVFVRNRKSIYTTLIKEYLAPFTNAFKLVLREVLISKFKYRKESSLEKQYSDLFSNIPEHVSSRLSEILLVIDACATCSNVSATFIEGFTRGRFKFSRLQHVYAAEIDSFLSLIHYDLEKKERKHTSLPNDIKDMQSTILQYPILNTYSYYGSRYFKMKSLDLIKGADGVALFSKHDLSLFKLCHFNEHKSLKHTFDVLLDRISSQICLFVLHRLKLRQLVYDYQIKDWLLVLRFIASLKYEEKEFVLSKCGDIDEIISILFKERRQGAIYPKFLSIERIVQQYYAENYFILNEESEVTVQQKRRRIYKRR